PVRGCPPASSPANGAGPSEPAPPENPAFCSEGGRAFQQGPIVDTLMDGAGGGSFSYSRASLRRTRSVRREASDAKRPGRSSFPRGHVEADDDVVVRADEAEHPRGRLDAEVGHAEGVPAAQAHAPAAQLTALRQDGNHPRRARELEGAEGADAR